MRKSKNLLHLRGSDHTGFIDQQDVTGAHIQGLFAALPIGQEFVYGIGVDAHFRAHHGCGRSRRSHTDHPVAGGFDSVYGQASRGGFTGTGGTNADHQELITGGECACHCLLPGRQRVSLCGEFSAAFLGGQLENIHRGSGNHRTRCGIQNLILSREHTLRSEQLRVNTLVLGGAVFAQILARSEACVLNM